MMVQHTNHLLNVLSPESRNRLLSKSKLIDLPLQTQLQPEDAQPTHAFLLVTGLASVVVNLADGSSSEVLVIGREGITGCLSLLGPSAPPSECYMQVAGSGYKILFSDLKTAFLDSEEIRTQILAITQQQTLTTGQIAACNKQHDNEARLARWLLMAQDRLQEELLPLTQEVLAVMLGSQRTTIAVSAGTLQRAGMIEYRRGKVKILSREALESAACDCYQVTKRLFEALLK